MLVLKLIYLLLGIGMVAPAVIFGPLGLEEGMRIAFYAVLFGAVFVLSILSISKRKFKTKELTELAGLAAVSIVFQMLPAPLRDPFIHQIRLDFVGIPWVMAFFTHGIYGALLVSVSVFFVMIPISQGGGIIGAFSKFYATIPMFLAAYAIVRLTGRKLSNSMTAALCLIGGVVFRGVLMCVINYYFAGPLFFGATTEQIMGMIDPVSLFSLNAVIGLSDFIIPYYLVFKRKIGKVHACLRD